MSQGFTKSQLVGSIIRDPNAASPACFETSLTVGSSAARLGTTLTAHATPHTKATTYTTLIASTAQIANGFWIAGYDVAATSTDTGMLLDIAKGAAASEVDLVQNVDMGECELSTTTGARSGSGKFFYFPGLSIPASTRISARIQATVTVDTLIVSIWMDYRMQHQIANSSWVTYGANTAASKGTSVPQAVNAFGVWTAVGSTTSRNHNLFAVGFDSLGDISVSTEEILIEIGYGPNAGAVVSIGIVKTATGTNESFGSCFPPLLAFLVASGSQLWARIASSSVDNRGIIIYGN